MWRWIRFSLIAVAFLGNISLATNLEPHQNDPFLKYKSINSVILSPDGDFTLILFATPYFDKSDPNKSYWKRSFLITSNKKEEKKDILYETPSGSFDFSWVPNGKEISFISQGDQYLSLWVMPLESLKPRKFLELDKNIYAHKWSPDGNKIVVSKDVSQTIDLDSDQYIHGEGQVKTGNSLCLIDVTKEMKISKVQEPLNSSDVPITTYSLNAVPMFNWSPDRSKIAFVTATSSKGKNEIAILDTKTGKVLFEIQGKGAHARPIFSPNGEWLAFVTNDFLNKEKVKNDALGIGPSRVCIIDHLQKSACEPKAV